MQQFHCMKPPVCTEWNELCTIGCQSGLWPCVPQVPLTPSTCGKYDLTLKCKCHSRFSLSAICLVLHVFVLGKILLDNFQNIVIVIDMSIAASIWYLMIWNTVRKAANQGFVIFCRCRIGTMRSVNG